MDIEKLLHFFEMHEEWYKFEWDPMTLTILANRLWYNIDDLPKAVIRDLAHDGIRTPVVEFESHLCDL